MLRVIFYYKDTVLACLYQTETIYTKIKENYIYINACYTVHCFY